MIFSLFFLSCRLLESLVNDGELKIIGACMIFCFELCVTRYFHIKLMYAQMIRYVYLILHLVGFNWIVDIMFETGIGQGRSLLNIIL